MELGIDYWLEILDKIQWLLDPARHWLYSAILGSLVFSLTLIILFVFGLIWERLTHREMSTDAVWYMIISSLLVGASAALGLHYCLDFGWSALDLPFNSLPLELNIPEHLK